MSQFTRKDGTVVSLEDAIKLSEEEIKEHFGIGDQATIFRAKRTAGTSTAEPKPEVKKVGSTPAKKIVAKAKPVSVNFKGAVKEAKKIVAAKKAAKSAKPAEKSASKPDSRHCSVCGKLLSRHASVSNGMGDECAQKIGIAKSLGFTDVKEHFQSLVVKEVPAGYIKLRDAVAFAKKNGVSGYALLQACGGNRMLKKPFSKNFKVIVHANTRYIPVAFKTELKQLKAK